MKDKKLRESLGFNDYYFEHNEGELARIWRAIRGLARYLGIEIEADDETIYTPKDSKKNTPKVSR